MRRQTEYFRHLPKEVGTTKVTWEEFVLEKEKREKDARLL